MTVVLVVVVIAFATLAICELVSVHRSPCSRHGHRWTLQLTKSRIYLSCDMCGTETPGWQLFGVRTGAQEAGDV